MKQLPAEFTKKGWNHKLVERDGPVGLGGWVSMSVTKEWKKQAREGENPPPAKKGWRHSEMVLVYYAADPEMDRIGKWSIAYYHYDPPHDDKPAWVDFNTDRGTPDYWWPLPEMP